MTVRRICDRLGIRSRIMARRGSNADRKAVGLVGRGRGKGNRPRGSEGARGVGKSAAQAHSVLRARRTCLSIPRGTYAVSGCPEGDGKKCTCLRVVRANTGWGYRFFF